ncbi:unnamed protein product [Didymodactylos carnosus]|uniref:VWFA domain-containing protein n=1 Tax=Didymodactylos carnosus TaxID=1234261 RepID=A0A815GXC2_9BILA|nr:unnamed protein product [Didymodactylos carnosus]CAF1430071.1 unnamed protein product [Didymodactylos carnosus]CAF4209017.1 unnamed protein product [Didymodactylos carnosus]CAF4228377.1 unnamed protein product [Didymodactylos carnosus]
MTPLTVTASQFPVQLSLSQEKKFFPHEISTYIQHVNVHIKTDEDVQTHSKPPQELFLLLDTSTSMAGENKWTNAILAIESIIRNMNSEDKLHLIQYNSRSSIIFENENDQRKMLNALHALYPTGSTNLMAGFDQVITLFKKYSERLTLKRLFVFSDGQINQGVTQHEQLLKEVTYMKTIYEITICSFGIGADFDEKLMTNIADHGSGDYFFIQGADSMKKVVDIAYKGFQSLMGTNAYLKITTKNDAHIVDVYGYELKNGENQIIPIGDIRYDDMMNILFQTEVKITEKLLEQSEIDYMIIELWMTDVVDRLSKLVTSKSVLFSFSKNEEELNDLNKVIARLVELQQIQRREKEVTELLREQRVQDAIKLKQNLADQVEFTSKALYEESAWNDEDLATIEYAKLQADTMKRRSSDMVASFSSGIMKDAELAKQNEYYRKLSEKSTKMHAEL